MEYAALRRKLSDVEKGAAKARRRDLRDDVISSLARLKPGDVILVPNGKFAGYAVVVDPGLSHDEPRPQVVTAGGQARRLALIDFATPVAAVDQLKVPRHFHRRNPPTPPPLPPPPPTN